MSTISSKLETVTPEAAAELLERNKTNRHLNLTTVRSYAKDIVAGRWDTNGEAIIIDWNGNLLNGQHRCWAIIESDTPLQTMVTRGVDPKTFRTIDSGRKRTAADVLGMQGISNTHITASGLRLINFIANGGTDFESVYKMSNARAMELLERHPGVVEAASAVAGTKIRRLMPGSPVVATMYFAMKANREKALRFLHDLDRGENLSKGMPCYTLRSLFIQRTRTARMRNTDQLALIIKAWNAYYRGRELQVLKFTASEDFPMPAGVPGL